MEKSNTSKNYGFIFILAAALCWSCGGVFLKFVEANVFVISCLRCIVGLIAMMALNHSLPIFSIKNPDGSINKYETILLWAGGLTFAFTSITYVIANKLTTAANAILLQYTNPVWIIIFGPMLLGEKNTRIDYITILGVLSGMVLFFADELFSGLAEVNFTSIAGNFVAIASGCGLAFYTMLMRKQKSGKAVESTMLSQLITIIICLPALIHYGIPSPSSCLFITLTGLINGALAGYFYPIGMRTVPALNASLLCMLEPLMNPIWVMIFTDERPSLLCIAGGAVIIIFVATRTWRKR